jgi:phosphoadenosine phosphosulfate reductase
MGLSQLNFAGLNKVEVSVMRIQEASKLVAPIALYGAYSGGKDSDTVKLLANMAGVPVEWHFHQTTVDPIEVLNYIKGEHPEVIWDRPDRTMYKLIEQDGFPMRQHKKCCVEFKENGGEGRFVLTGIRWQESGARKTRSMIEVCTKGVTKKFLHPIIDWTEREVWEFLDKNNSPRCSLYSEGFKRIGCVLCPNHGADEVQYELKRFPAIAKAYRIAFGRFYDRQTEGVKRWKSAEEMWQWWLSRKGQKKDAGQCSMFI